MWFVYSFLKDFLSHLTIFIRLQAKRHAKHPENDKGIIFCFDPFPWQNMVCKNENGTVSLPIFMITFPYPCELVHRLFWEDVFPNTTMLLLSMSSHHKSLWISQGARDAWCSGSKAQFAGCSLSGHHCFNFLFSMLLAGERKRVWWCNRDYDTWILHHADQNNLKHAINPTWD